MLKKCNICGLEKDIIDFCKSKQSKDGYLKKCLDCERTRQKKTYDKYRTKRIAYSKEYYSKNNEKISLRVKKYNKTPNRIYQRIKYRTNFYNNKGNLNISKDEFIKWYNEQKKECVYCDIDVMNIKILPNCFMKNPDRLTIDRKKSNGDYELDNICLSCSVCNAIKNNVLSYEEMKEIGHKYIKPKWQSQVGDKN